MVSTDHHREKFMGKIPKHAEIGCLAMIGGVILGFLMTPILSKAIPFKDTEVIDVGQFVIVLIISSFAAGIFVGIVCKERRGLYAVLTTILFPSILPPTALLIWYVLGVLDGQLMHPFLIPIILCPIFGFLGAKLYGWMLNLYKRLLHQ